MMQIIPCDCCGKTGHFEVHLEVSEAPECCKACNHIKEKSEKYWFCNFKCLLTWMKKNRIGKNTKAPLKIKDRHRQFFKTTFGIDIAPETTAY